MEHGRTPSLEHGALSYPSNQLSRVELDSKSNVYTADQSSGPLKALSHYVHQDMWCCRTRSISPTKGGIIPCKMRAADKLTSPLVSSDTFGSLRYTAGTKAPKQLAEEVEGGGCALMGHPAGTGLQKYFRISTRHRGEGTLDGVSDVARLAATST